MKKIDEPSAALEEVTIDVNNIETIYVDKITNVGISANVSKLTLTRETDGASRAFANIIIPTIRLFDFIEFMSENVVNNDKLKQDLVTSLDEFKNKLIASEDKTDN